MNTEEKWTYVSRGGRSSTTALPPMKGRVDDRWGTPTKAVSAPTTPSVKDTSAFPPLAAKKPAVTSSVAEKPAPKKLDFRAATERGASAAAAREKEESEYAAYMALHSSSSAADRSRLSRIGNRCFDDGPEDYDGPEEDELFEDGEGMPAYEMGSAEAEFNAHLAVVRRSGDKSDW